MTMRNIKKGSFKKGEDAVSPVIGVILMVAITVILAAVIGAFVFGMGSDTKRSYIVAATASEVYNTTAEKYDITVTYNGGPDADRVAGVNVTKAGSVTLSSTNRWLNSTGATEVYLDAGSSGRSDAVIVAATFVDGTTQVILNTHV